MTKVYHPKVLSPVFISKHNVCIMRYVLLIATVFLYSSLLWSQTELIAFQGFEPEQSSWGPPVFSTPPCTMGDDYWDVVDQLGPISPVEGEFFWGIQDLNGSCGSPGFEWIELPPVDVSGFQSVVCRMDFRVVGYDSGDDIELEPWFDGKSQGRALLVDGASDYSTEGWVETLIEVPNKVSEFKLRIYVKQNGTDQAGFDNIRLEGVQVEPCSEIMISEYAEGTSSTGHRNNYVELFNPTESIIELEGYELVKYTGSSSEPSSRLALSGSLAPFGSFLIEDISENLGISADLSTNSSVMDFNGDDKIGLMFQQSLLDVVGVVGDSLVFARDVTLRRKSGVKGPNSEYDPEEWDTYDLEETGNLGQHQSICSGPSPEIEVFGLGQEIPDGQTGSRTHDNTYFGTLDTASGESITHLFVVRNSGWSDLSINAIQVEGEHAVDYRLEFDPLPVLPVADSLVFKVIFSTTSVGIRNARIRLVNNDPSESVYDFQLQGEGTSYTQGPLMISTYYEGEGNNRWLEISNVSPDDVSAGSFYLALFRQDVLNAPIGSKPSVKRAIPFLPAGESLKFRATLNVSEPSYALDGSEIGTGVCGFNGDDVLVVSSTDDESCWENRVDMIGRPGLWGRDIAYVRKYGCEQELPNSGFDPSHWLPYAPEEIDSALVGTNERLGEYHSGETRFLSGAWTNGLPNLYRSAVIMEDFSTAIHGQVQACNLRIEPGARLRVENGEFIAIQNDLVVDGALEVMHGGEILMIDNSGVVESSGSIVIHRKSSPLKAWDYTYWSSPVESADLETVFIESDPEYIFSFTTSSFVDEDQDGVDDSGEAWTRASGTMIPGRGYASIAPKPLPGDRLQKLIFQGKVNNGPIDIPIELANSADSLNDWNLIGNPYPSSIDAEMILVEPGNNGLLNGSFYFWTHNTALEQDQDSGRWEYSSDDYAMYTVGTGGIRATSGGALPTRHIASGQAFFAEAHSAGSLRLSNEMRSAGQDSHFFKEPLDKTRYEAGKVWLNLENENGVFSQILIGFKPGATSSFDSMYDGRRFSGNAHADLYSVLDSLALAIRGEPPFRGDERIPLGMRIKSSGIDRLNIRIDSLAGRLEQGEIHILDHNTGVRHDLKAGPYSFLSPGVGAIDDRFVLLFGESAQLESPAEIETDNGLICFFERGDLRVRTRNSDRIMRLEVFDLLGRRLAQLQPAQSAVLLESPGFASNALYVIRALLENREILSTKVVHVWP